MFIIVSLFEFADRAREVDGLRFVGGTSLTGLDAPNREVNRRTVAEASRAPLAEVEQLERGIIIRGCGEARRRSAASTYEYSKKRGRI